MAGAAVAHGAAAAAGAALSRVLAGRSMSSGRQQRQQVAAADQAGMPLMLQLLHLGALLQLQQGPLALSMASQQQRGLAGAEEGLSAAAGLAGQRAGAALAPVWTPLRCQQLMMLQPAADQHQQVARQPWRGQAALAGTRQLPARPRAMAVMLPVAGKARAVAGATAGLPARTASRQQARAASAVEAGQQEQQHQVVVRAAVHVVKGRVQEAGTAGAAHSRKLNRQLSQQQQLLQPWLLLLWACQGRHPHCLLLGGLPAGHQQQHRLGAQQPQRPRTSLHCVHRLRQTQAMQMRWVRRLQPMWCP